MHQHLAAWWNGISLRTKITGVTVMLLTLGLLVAGAGTMSLLRTYLLGEVDSRVKNAAEELGVAEREGHLDDFVTGTGNGECRVTAGLGEGVYTAVLGATGRLRCDNVDEGKAVPDLSGVTLEDILDNDGDAFTVSDSGNTNQWRIVAQEVFVDADGLNTIVVGESLSPANGVVARFAAIFMFFALAVVVLGGVSTRLLVASTFAPLRDVEQTAARFADGDFSQRLSGALPNTEVGRLSRSLNLMLARIDNAFSDRSKTIEQMRRFVGDASHELRTPLVSVRGYAELYRMGALATDNDVKQAMERIENEAVRMSELVSDLLELARLDETRPLNLREIDLGPIAHDAALDARAGAPDRAVTVVPLEITEEPLPEPAPLSETGELALAGKGSPSRTATFAGAQLARLRALRTRTARRLAEAPPEEGDPTQPRAIVLGEENKIRQVVTNLMGNAQRYSPAGSPIELGVGVDLRRRMGVIAIIDHGRGIPPQMRDKIFQRFWRADTSRTRETGGSGLGLAIVAAIVASHGGMIEVDETPGGGATFRVSLPLAPSFADRTPEDEVD